MRSHAIKRITLTIVLFFTFATTWQVFVRAQRPPQPAKPVEPQDQRKPDRPQNPADERARTPEGEALKIDTELVQLDVKVIDQSNRPVFNLAKDDFTVFEDNIKQAIEHVGREEVPVSLGLVVDTSGSMKLRLKTVSDAALGLIKQMRDDDEGFVAQFKTEAELIQEFTQDKRALEDAIFEMFTSGGTALLDAIIATADYAAAKGKKRRKALIVISDGLEKNSSVKEREVKEAIKESEVQLYLIGFIDEEEGGGFLSKPSGKKAKELLIRLAEDSGGRAFFPKDVSEMPAIAAQISEDLRTQYVISYYPTNETRDDTFRTVRVMVNPKNNRKLIARTRQGYYARRNAPAQATRERRVQ